MEFEVPKKHISKPTLSNVMVQKVLRWERQKMCFGKSLKKKKKKKKSKGPWQKNYSYNKILMNFFWGLKREQRHDKTREWSNLFFLSFFPKLPFLDILKKLSRSLIVAWSFLFVHIRITPSKGPKNFVKWLFKKSDDGKKVIFHGPNSWCKLALTSQLLLVNNSSRSNPWRRYFTTRLRKTMLE